MEFDSDTATKGSQSGDTQKMAFFHSVTIPQQLSDSNVEMSKCGRVNLAKNCKFEIHVLYYQTASPIAEKTDNHHPRSSLGENAQQVTPKYLLKRKRILIGRKSVKDISDGIENVNPLIAKGMQTRSKDLLFTGSGYNINKIRDIGGFLSKQFWATNLLWGSEGSLVQNLLTTIDRIKSDMPFIDVKERKLGNGQAFKKSKTLKTCVHGLPVMVRQNATSSTDGSQPCCDTAMKE